MTLQTAKSVFYNASLTRELDAYREVESNSKLHISIPRVIEHEFEAPKIIQEIS